MNEIPKPLKILTTLFLLIAGYFICYFLGKWLDWGSFSFIEGVIWYPIVEVTALGFAGVALLLLIYLFMIVHFSIWED